MQTESKSYKGAQMGVNLSIGDKVVRYRKWRDDSQRSDAYYGIIKEFKEVNNTIAVAKIEIYKKVSDGGITDVTGYSFQKYMKVQTTKLFKVS